MSDMTIVAVLTTLIVLVVGGTIHLASRRFSTTAGDYPTGEAGLRSLVEDIRAASHSVVVFCASCNLSQAHRGLVSDLKNAIREKSRRQIPVLLVTGNHVPKELAELEREGALAIERVSYPLPFIGRVIDASVVERHFGVSGGMYPRGHFVRAENAQELATELIAQHSAA